MTEVDLKAKYPYMFDGPNIGIDLYAGWLPTLAAACEAVDKILGTDKAGFHFSQIKEKYGSARFYWACESRDDDVQKQIAPVIDLAELATESICMLCGAPAQIQEYDRWSACLCDTHARDRRQRNRRNKDER